MGVASLGRLCGLLGPAALIVLGCQRLSTVDGAGTSTGSTSTDDGSDGSGSTGSSTGTQDTGTTGSGCGVVQLYDVEQGRGGFAVYGDADGDETGQAVSGVGDINGDGLADMAVGAPRAGVGLQSYSGRIYVVFGKTDTASMSAAALESGSGGFVLDGEARSDHFGTSVSGAGDVDGDGLADMVVGAPYGDPGNVYNPGRIYVVLGSTDTAPTSLQDVASGVGGFVLDGGVPEECAGSSVSGAGDVNGDGLADVVVGAWRAAPNGDPSGRAYVVFGKADTDSVSLADVADGTGGFAVDGELSEDQLGWSVSGAGDTNGDGLADVILGAPQLGIDDDRPGRAYVVLGKADTESVSATDLAQGVGGFVLDGEAEYDHSGRAVAGVGDVNGDGLADVAVGAQGAGAPDRVYVVFGSTDTAPVRLADVAQGTGGFVVDGEDVGLRSAWSVSGVGDLDQDGLAEVVVGAPWVDPSGQFAGGRAYVVFGKTDTDPISLVDVARGTGGFRVDGVELDQCGNSVSGAGDMDGDGVDDIVVGAAGVLPYDFSPGRAYVVLGGDFSCDDG